MARPSVDGLERRFRGRMDVVRIDSGTDDGARLAGRYGVTALPTYLVVDGAGNVLYRKVGGWADGDEIERRLAQR
jgi:hypothetical protein